MNGPISCSETNSLYKELTDYITALYREQDNLEKTTEKLTDLIKETTLLYDKMKAEGLTLLMAPDRITEEAKAVSYNVRKLRTQRDNMQQLLKVFNERTTFIKSNLQALKDIYQQANKTGVEAVKENLYKPIDIFNKFHPGPRTKWRNVALFGCS